MVKTLPSNARGTGLIPSQGAKIPYALWPKNQNIKQKQYYNELNPGWLSGKRISLQCRSHRRCGFDPWVGKIPWRRTWQLLQYSCLENPMDRGAWWAIVHGVAKSQTPLSYWTRTHSFNKWLSQAYCVPGTLLGMRGTSMGEKKRFCPMELTYTSLVAAFHTLH